MFSRVRSKNPVPTPLQFKNNLQVLTVAQYLKGAESGSYHSDDGYSLTDFLDVTTALGKRSPESLPQTLVSDCEALFQQTSSDTVVLDAVELCTLYYLAGYVISRVEKRAVLCSKCVSALRCTDYLREIDPAITKLVVLKEFRSGSLVPSSQLVFDLLTVAESRFRELEPFLLTIKSNVKQHVVNEIIMITDDLHFRSFFYGQSSLSLHRCLGTAENVDFRTISNVCGQYITVNCARNVPFTTLIKQALQTLALGLVLGLAFG